MKFFKWDGKLYNSANVVSVETKLEEEEISHTTNKNNLYPYEQITIREMKVVAVALITMSNNDVVRVMGKEFEGNYVLRNGGKLGFRDKITWDITSEVISLSVDDFIDYHLNGVEKFAMSIITGEEWNQ